MDEIKPVEMPNNFSELDRAEAIGKTLKEENIKAAELLRKNEEILKRQLIGGNSYSGQTTAPVETADEKWAREAKIRYAGTGLDPTPRIKDGN